MQGLDRIFATTEEGIPWKVQSETVFDGGVSEQNWIGLWQKYFNQNLMEAFKSFIYIGYCGRIKDAISVRKYKVRDLLTTSQRKVFNCYLIGHRQCGKSSFLDQFVRSPQAGLEYREGGKERSVINEVLDSHGTPIYLILTEIPES
mmetsp:Transcript_25942/g.25196  ORF Transcript_25942/g.25196 Transcript_25942/m.25196 type:complete len:146 (+) Transcript_25942:678-1115(+)